DEGIKGAEEPDAEEEPVIGEARGDVAGSAHDAGRNGIADGDGDAKPDAEDAFVRIVPEGNWQIGPVQGTVISSFAGYGDCGNRRRGRGQVREEKEGQRGGSKRNR